VDKIGNTILVQEELNFGVSGTKFIHSP